MAAASSVIKGTNGARTMKGLFLICTLLSLICFTSSLFNKEQLAEMKELHQRSIETLEKLKSERNSIVDTSAEMMSDFTKMMDNIIGLARTFDKVYGDLPLEQFLKGTKDFLAKAKVSVNKKNDYLDVNIAELDNNIKKREKLINFLEEQQAEL